MLTLSNQQIYLHVKLVWIKCNDVVKLSCYIIFALEFKKKIEVNLWIHLISWYSGQLNANTRVWGDTKCDETGMSDIRSMEKSGCLG